MFIMLDVTMYHGHPQGGARIGTRLPPPPGKKHLCGGTFFSLSEFCLYLDGVFLWEFLLYVSVFFSLWEFFHQGEGHLFSLYGFFPTM